MLVGWTDLTPYESVPGESFRPINVELQCDVVSKGAFGRRHHCRFVAMHANQSAWWRIPILEACLACPPMLSPYVDGLTTNADRIPGSTTGGLQTLCLTYSGKGKGKGLG